MRDGSKVTGQFSDGELTGFGLKKWADGKVYQGEFLEGEMHGTGHIVYAETDRTPDAAYEG